MNAKDELQKEFFQFSVKINGDIAKWENHKHPDNPDFQQTVYWRAYIANDNLIIRYCLDQTDWSRNKIHCVKPINEMPFEQAVFEYWKNN